MYKDEKGSQKRSKGFKRGLATEVLSVFLLVFIFFALISTCNCNGLSAKLQDDLNQVKKNTEKIAAEQKIQGDNNTQAFTKITETTETTIQSNKKLNEQFSKSNKAQADKIEKLIQTSESNVNSSWMVWGIVGVVSLISVIALTGAFWLMRFIIKKIDNIDKAVDE